jgi:hypothetical protein
MYAKAVLVDFLHGLLFNPEDGGSMFLQNVYGLLPDYTALMPEDSTLPSSMKEDEFSI